MTDAHDKRPPGRPRIDPTHPPARVNLTLHTETYDRLHRVARHYGVSVPEIVRVALRREFLTQKPGES